MIKAPTKFVDIDFETRSVLDVTVVGAKTYAEHPSTEIMMVSFSIDQETVYNWNPFISVVRNRIKFERAINRVKRNSHICFRAFNSEFEYWIYNLVGTRQFGWPALGVEKFYDVMVVAGIMGFPHSLENACLAAGAEFAKNPEGKALINFFSKPSKAKGEKFKNPLEYKDKFNRFIQYCDDDVKAQIALANKCNPMTDYQYQRFLLTERMNVRGLPINIRMATGALKLVEMYKDKANDRIKYITEGKIESATQTIALQEWLNSEGCEIPNLKAATIEKFLSPAFASKLTPATREALVIRSNVSKSSTAKYTKAIELISKTGTIHGFIKALLALTGRWKGFGIQIHNFSKPGKGWPKWADYMVLSALIESAELDIIETIYQPTMDTLKAATRAMIQAPPGYKFVTADYSQIEARIVMWMAGDKVGLKDFSGEGKIYEAMAASIFNLVISAIAKGSFQRDVGKETVLGCGFGMGDKKFLITCTGKNIPLDSETAKKAVKGYRTRYKRVPQAWKDCERAAIKALEHPGSVFEACDGKIKYKKEGEHLYARIPSGRKLVYAFAKLVDDIDQWGNEKVKVRYKSWDGQAPVANRWRFEDIWGGTFFQHAVQGTASDIMADGMLNAEAHGYPSLFTVHDEAVSLVPEDFGSVSEYEGLLCVLKDYAKGLPVVSEGWEGPCYRK